MLILSPRLRALDRAERVRYESIAEMYEAALLDGALHDLEPFLPAEQPLRTLVLVHLARCDLEQRKKRGMPVRVEDYVARFSPELAEDDDACLELVLWERQYDAEEATQECAARYPKLAARLRDLLPQLRPADVLPLVAGYEVLGVLGRGGMGVVYKARHKQLQRLVALKLLRRGAHPTTDEVDRFRREALAVAALRHPHIVDVYDYVENGEPYLEMMFCPGGSLADQVKPMDPRPAAELVAALTGAVAHAHDCGIIHRDLKPANVLFDSEGNPRVSDFGLVKRFNPAAREPSLTQKGAIVGTPSYMAPEQALDLKVGPAVDVYALGAILYEMLTGCPPFRAANTFETLEQVIHSPPVAPRSLNSAVPRDLETVCLKCLHKDPARRYLSAVELAHDLTRFLTGQPVLARPVTGFERAWKWIRRHPTLASLSAAFVLALIAGIVASTHFALDARRQADVAWNREQDARAREREANYYAGEATKALLRNQVLLAAGLLRPLGHNEHSDRLNEFEMDALEELGGLSAEHDRVRILFIELALAQEGIAVQLERRLNEAAIAAVGLRRGLRQQALDIVARRLRDPSTGRAGRIASARLAATLAAENSELVRVAAAILFEALGRTRGGQATRWHRSFVVLVGKLTTTDASELASQIVITDELGHYMKGSSQWGLLKHLAGNVTPTYAPTLAKRIVELDSKTTSTSHFNGCWESFIALGDKVPPDEAATYASTLANHFMDLAVKVVDLRDKLRGEQIELFPPTIMCPLTGFDALAAKMMPRDRTKLTTRLVALTARKSILPFELSQLLTYFTILSAKAPADVVGKDVLILANRIIARATAKDTKEGDLEFLSRSFAALKGKLTAPDAFNLENRIVKLAEQTRTSRLELLPFLTEVFAALADKLPEADARKHAVTMASHIVQLNRNLRAARVLRLISNSFAPLVDYLTAPEAAKHASTLANCMVDLVATKPDDFNKEAVIFRGISASFAKLAGKLTKTDRSTLASRLADLIARKTSTGYVLDFLSECLKTLSGAIPKDKVAIHAAKLVHRILEGAAARTTIQSLSDCFAALAAKKPPVDASPIAMRIADLAAKTSDARLLISLSTCFAALGGNLSADQAGKQAFQIAKKLIRTISITSDTNVQLPRDTLARLSALLDPESLLDLLKQPGCTDFGRAVLLAEFGKRFNCQFNTIWDMVDHVENHKLRRALSTPLQRQQHIPAAVE